MYRQLIEKKGNFSLRRIGFLFTSLLAISFNQAFCNEEMCCHSGLTLEVKTGYFFFSDSKMDRIYDRGGWDVQVSGLYPIWDCLQIYGSVEYVEKHGKSLHDKQRTSIRLVPLSLGLQAIFPLYCNVEYYLTLGPRYFFVNQHNHSSFVNKHLNRNGLGGFVNAGLQICLMEDFFLDIFGEYSYKRMHFHSHKKHVEGRTIQIGGFTFGAGLGRDF